MASISFGKPRALDLYIRVSYKPASFNAPAPGKTTLYHFNVWLYALTNSASFSAVLAFRIVIARYIAFSGVGSILPNTWSAGRAATGDAADSS